MPNSTCRRVIECVRNRLHIDLLSASEIRTNREKKNWLWLVVCGNTLLIMIYDVIENDPNLVDISTKKDPSTV